MHYNRIMTKRYRLKITQPATPHRTGFTIIEAIVAISIIAILSAVTVYVFISVQKQSRDARRSSDVSDIKGALDKYHARNGEYPAACFADGTTCSVTSLASALAPYLKSIPNDPTYPKTNYSYVRGPVGANSYGLYIPNEAIAACKDGVRVDQTWWGSGVPVC